VGYTFEIAIPDGTTFQLELEGLVFDGRPNGTGAWTVASTTWLGAIYNTSQGTTPSQAFFTKVQVHNCVINYSRAPNAVGLDLRAAYWVNVTDTRIAFFPFGYATRVGTFNVVSTTIVFRKCYLNYNQHCMRIDGNVLDVQLYDTVFESSVVAFSAITTKMLLSGCYFENIGYSLDSGAVANTGLVNKDFGISFGVPALATPVISAMNVCYAEVVFMSCLFAYRGTMIKTLHPTSRWLYMLGRGSTNGAGGSAVFHNCRVITWDGGLLEVVTDAQANFTDDNGCSVEWYAGSQMTKLPYADIRNIRKGSLFVEAPFPGGLPDYVQYATVENGRLFIHNPGYTTPTDSPTGGQWIVGDTLIYGNPTIDGPIGAVCVTAGTPGTWRTYGEKTTETATAANIAAVANAINTTGKYVGKQVWDTTNNRMMRARGTAAADPWDVIDGSTSVTPS
jgi:hypothetical protein